MSKAKTLMVGLAGAAALLMLSACVSRTRSRASTAGVDP